MSVGQSWTFCFLFLSALEQKTLGRLSNCFTWCCQNCIQRVLRSTFRKSNRFFYKPFSYLGRKILVVLAERNCRVIRTFFKLFIGIFWAINDRMTFSKFLMLGETFSALWPQFFGSIVRTAFYVSIRTFGESCFVLKPNSVCFSLFGLLAKTFRLLRRTYRLVCQNCIVRVHWNILSKVFKLFKNLSRTVNESFSAIWPFVFGRVVKTAIICL